MVQNISGQTFNRLFVRQLSHIKNGHAHWVCDCECGNETIVAGNNLKSGQTKSCGCLSLQRKQERHGDKHPLWQGGKRKAKGGYVDVLHNGKYVSEHRYVMEQHLGRPLFSDETVHHKNGVRHDNHIDNLELWSASHPPGQRIEDKVAWAKEILQRYS
jgi:hypothetical protein